MFVERPIHSSFCRGPARSELAGGIYTSPAAAASTGQDRGWAQWQARNCGYSHEQRNRARPTRRIRVIVDWSSFTPWTALAGGVLIGLAAAIFVLFNGRIA